MFPSSSIGRTNHIENQPLLQWHDEKTPISFLSFSKVDSKLFNVTSGGALVDPLAVIKDISKKTQTIILNKMHILPNKGALNSYRSLKRISPVFVAGFVCLVNSLPAHADLVLETETAELGKKGDVTLSSGIQFESAKGGGTTAFTLNQFEYAVTDRAEILIEPFFKEWDHPPGEPRFSGTGDLEITPSYMVSLEKPHRPAVVLAFKLKVPTAHNLNIGTRKFDYLPYVILGKTYGNWVLNANLGYNFITSPSKDEPLKNQVIYDLSIERKLTPKLSVFGEVFANTSPALGQTGTFSAALATEYHFNNHFNAFVSTGYDTDHLFNIRPGVNLEF